MSDDITLSENAAVRLHQVAALDETFNTERTPPELVELERTIHNLALDNAALQRRVDELEKRLLNDK